MMDTLEKVARAIWGPNCALREWQSSIAQAAIDTLKAEGWREPSDKQYCDCTVGMCESRDINRCAFQTVLVADYQKVPDGYMVVPKEATEKMADVAFQYRIACEDGDPGTCYDLWRAMIKAADDG